MDRDGWLKSMTQLYTIYGGSPINNQIIFFSGHDINFDGRALCFMWYQNIQPFVLKSGNSGNNHINKNGPNAILKSLYRGVKFFWMLNFGGDNFPPHHKEPNIGGSIERL